MLPGVRTVHLLERLEHPREFVRGDPDAGVAHLDPDAPAIVPDDDRHAAGIGELHGIADEIDQDLSHALRVARLPGGAGERTVEMQLQALRAGAAGRQVDDVAQRRPEIEGGRHQLQLAGFRPGEIEDVVDEFQQVLPGALDEIQPLAVGRRDDLVAHQPDRAQDAVQRRAHLVTHGREELALHGAVPLRLDEGLGALLGHLDELVAQAEHLLRGLRRLADVVHDEREVAGQTGSPECAGRVGAQQVPDGHGDDEREDERERRDGIHRLRQDTERGRADDRGGHRREQVDPVGRYQSEPHEAPGQSVEREHAGVPASPEHCVVDGAAAPIAAIERDECRGRDHLADQPADHEFVPDGGPQEPGHEQRERHDEQRRREVAVVQQADLGREDAGAAHRLEIGRRRVRFAGQGGHGCAHRTNDRTTRAVRGRAARRCSKVKDGAGCIRALSAAGAMTLGPVRGVRRAVARVRRSGSGGAS